MTEYSPMVGTGPSSWVVTITGCPTLRGFRSVGKVQPTVPILTFPAARFRQSIMTMRCDKSRWVL